MIPKSVEPQALVKIRRLSIQQMYPFPIIKVLIMLAF